MGSLFTDDDDGGTAAPFGLSQRIMRTQGPGIVVNVDKQGREGGTKWRTRGPLSHWGTFGVWPILVCLGLRPVRDVGGRVKAAANVMTGVRTESQHTTLGVGTSVDDSEAVAATEASLAHWWFCERMMFTSVFHLTLWSVGADWYRHRANATPELRRRREGTHTWRGWEGGN